MCFFGEGGGGLSDLTWVRDLFSLICSVPCLAFANRVERCTEVRLMFAGGPRLVLRWVGVRGGGGGFDPPCFGLLSLPARHATCPARHPVEPPPGRVSSMHAASKVGIMNRWPSPKRNCFITQTTIHTTYTRPKLPRLLVQHDDRLANLVLLKQLVRLDVSAAPTTAPTSTTSSKPISCSIKCSNRSLLVRRISMAPGMKVWTEQRPYWKRRLGASAQHKAYTHFLPYSAEPGTVTGCVCTPQLEMTP